jgi:hypothetical protein
MTKNELLATAKEMNIVGRHDMTKEELAAAIDAARDAEAEAEAEVEEAHEADKSLDGDEMDFVGGNYVYTHPFRARLYGQIYLDEEAYAKLAPQAKKIFDFMSETKIVATGHDIVVAAVASGKLKTSQNPAVLFAFYARKLEDAGVRLITAG